MDKYLYQIATRLDGKYYYRIYQLGIRQQFATTDDYDEQEDALEAAEATIREHRALIDSP